MGYERRVSAKIVRVTHVITFNLGSRKKDLLDALKSVPDEARIIESEGSDELGDPCEIQFQTEENGEFYDD